MLAPTARTRRCGPITVNVRGSIESITQRLVRISGRTPRRHFLPRIRSRLPNERQWVPRLGHAHERPWRRRGQIAIPTTVSIKFRVRSRRSRGRRGLLTLLGSVPMVRRPIAVYRLNGCWFASKNAKKQADGSRSRFCAACARSSLWTGRNVCVWYQRRNLFGMR